MTKAHGFEPGSVKQSLLIFNQISSGWPPTPCCQQYFDSNDLIHKRHQLASQALG